MLIHCKYDALVPVGDLKPNPANRNRHPQNQLVALAKVLTERGWRHPVIVSKLSGLVAAGHGRIEAAKIAGFQSVPVVFQDFENEKLEKEFLHADNTLSLLSELDVTGIRLDAGLSDIDLSFLGLPSLDFATSEFPDLGDGSNPDFQQRTFILANDQSADLDEAMKIAFSKEEMSHEKNTNRNGIALWRMIKFYAESKRPNS